MPFPIPVPTPTPVISNQVLSAVKETVDLAFNQGLVGVLLLFAFTGAVIAIALAIYISRRPAKSTSERDVSLGLANLADKSTARAEKKDEEIIELLKQQKVVAEEHRVELAALTKESIAALSSNAAANNNIAEINRNYANEITAFRRAMEVMVTEGSEPLRRAIASIEEIKVDVKRLTIDQSNDRLLGIRIQSTLDVVQAVLTSFQIRATAEVNRVTLDNKPELGTT